MSGAMYRNLEDKKGSVKYLTLNEVAAVLRLQARTLRMGDWPKRLRARKVGGRWLVPEDAVADLLEGHGSQQGEAR